ncbi:hypothetical protein, partial [Escherichia coli]|uniref:hypothetical protein n=1 Tax=Escherichia coli TaxID=562 RepID=UPI0013D1238D
AVCAAVELDDAHKPNIAADFALIGQGPLHDFMEGKINPLAGIRIARRVRIVGAARHDAKVIAYHELLLPIAPL